MGPLSFSRRLFAGIATIVLILLIVSALAYNASYNTKIQVYELTDNHLPQLVKGQLIFNEVNTIARAIRNMQIIGRANDSDINLAEEEWQRIVEARKVIYKTINDLKSRAAAEGDTELAALLVNIEAQREIFLQVQDQYKQLFDRGELRESRELLLGSEA
jgi:methyl-accepting chemotaxis protein